MSGALHPVTGTDRPRRIALVSSVPVFPTSEGNRRRILNLGRALRSLGHRVDFVFLPSRSLPRLDLASHEAEFGPGQVHALTQGSAARLRVVARRGVAKLLRRLKRALGRADAFHIGLDELYDGGFTGQLAQLQQRRDFDVALVSYIFNTQAFAAFPPGISRILDSHDSFADRHLAVAGARSEGDYWFSVAPTTELAAFRRADTVLAIQSEEAGRFAARLGTPPPFVATVSHVVEIGPQHRGFDAVAAAFVGSANGPNLAALEGFIREALPMILAAIPTFRLHVVGSICAHLPDAPGIVKRGRVDDLSGVWRDAPLALNPMTVGTGINIKLLDAMAAGIGTVSTVLGARGLDGDLCGGLVTTPDGDAPAFAAAVIALARDEAGKRALGERAHAAALDWNRRQLQALAAVLDEPRVTGGAVACASLS